MGNSTKTACFCFSPELSFLLAQRYRSGIFDFSFSGPQSVKHLIESLGIPHTEVGSIFVNSEIQGLNYLVKDRDQIQIFSHPNEAQFELEGSPEPRFVLDGHLGRLAAYLRMLGLDCLYRNDYSDDELVNTCLEEERILLTRDRRLLMHKTINLGYLLRSLDPAGQLCEVTRRYNLKLWIKPFQRCLRCNHKLIQVEKDEVLPRLEPLTRKYFDEFHLCPGCQQIYWKGSHYQRMRSMIEQIDRCFPEGTQP